MNVKGYFPGLLLMALYAAEVQAACAPSCPTTTASGAITSTIVGPVTVASVSNLVFGTLVRPATSAGNGTISVVASTGSRTISGTALALASVTPSRAQFTVTGEGASLVTISTTSPINLTSGANTLAVTLTRNPSGASQTLGGSAGSDGTLTISVGGSFSLTNATVPGAYTGSVTLTATYQ